MTEHFFLLPVTKKTIDKFRSDLSSLIELTLNDVRNIAHNLSREIYTLFTLTESLKAVS